MDFKQQLREQKLGEVLEFPYELLTTIRFHVRFLNIKLFQEGKKWKSVSDPDVGVVKVVRVL
ncbi:MAG: hypothetical protein LUH22_18725 [Bacteroides sp.]|nr:hypothetical protein [Bacteroides sp.]